MSHAKLDMLIDHYEYHVPSEIEPLPFKVARWIVIADGSPIPEPIRDNLILARDSASNLVALFASQFYLDCFGERNPTLHLETLS